MGQRYQTLTQAQKYLEIDSAALEDLTRLGLLRVVTVGGQKMVGTSDLKTVRQWLDEDKTKHPALVITNLAARVRVLERQLESLMVYLKPPVTVSLIGMEDDDLDQLTHDALLAAEPFTTMDADRWLGVIEALDWSVLERIEDITAIKPAWKVFAGLLVEIDSWWLKYSRKRGAENDPLARQIPEGLARAKRTLRELILLSEGTDNLAFLEEHPRKVLASMMMPQ